MPTPQGPAKAARGGKSPMATPTKPPQTRQGAAKAAGPGKSTAATPPRVQARQGVAKAAEVAVPAEPSRAPEETGREEESREEEAEPASVKQEHAERAMRILAFVGRGRKFHNHATWLPAGMTDAGVAYVALVAGRFYSNPDDDSSLIDGHLNLNLEDKSRSWPSARSQWQKTVEELKGKRVLPASLSDREIAEAAVTAERLLIRFTAYSGPDAARLPDLFLGEPPAKAPGETPHRVILLPAPVEKQPVTTAQAVAPTHTTALPNPTAPVLDVAPLPITPPAQRNEDLPRTQIDRATPAAPALADIQAASTTPREQGPGVGDAVANLTHILKGAFLSAKGSGDQVSGAFPDSPMHSSFPVQESVRDQHAIPPAVTGHSNPHQSVDPMAHASAMSRPPQPPYVQTMPAPQLPPQQHYLHPGQGFPPQAVDPVPPPIAHPQNTERGARLLTPEAGAGEDSGKDWEGIYKHLFRKR